MSFIDQLDAAAKPVDTSKPRQVGAKVNAGDYQTLRALADERGLTVTQVVSTILKSALSQVTSGPAGAPGKGK